MADLLDPHDLAAIEKLAASGLWEQAGLVEARWLQELLKKQESLDAHKDLRRDNPEGALPQEPIAESSRLTEIQRELIGPQDGDERTGSGPRTLCRDHGRQSF